jgi:hypothetical protein
LPKVSNLATKENQKTKHPTDTNVKEPVEAIIVDNDETEEEEG